MDEKEPLEAQEVQHMTFNELIDLSMEEFRKLLALPFKIVEADKPDHGNPEVKLIQDAKGENNG